MATLSDLIAPFIKSVASGATEVYNEFSLQHELGNFLRREMSNCKVQFERNVGSFFPDKSQFSKREIDVTAICPDLNQLRWAIELKFPRNGQYPETMFSFCRDIAFVEELKAAGFSQTGLVIFAEDPLFYRGPSDGIYGFFRGGCPLTGRIQKPTGRKDSEVLVRATYNVKWEVILGSLMYAAIEVVDSSKD